VKARDYRGWSHNEGRGTGFSGTYRRVPLPDRNSFTRLWQVFSNAHSAWQAHPCHGSEPLDLGTPSRVSLISHRKPGRRTSTRAEDARVLTS
jgi:hypothetical protein